MKTLNILTMIVAFTAVTSLVAQDATSSQSTDNRNNLELGLKAGINYSNLYDEKGQNLSASSLLGFVGGGFLSIPIGTYLGVQPEVLYSEKGYSGQGTGTLGIGQYSYTDRLNFLDIPLMIQFKPSPNVYILGGPEYSYLLSRNYTFTNGVTSENTQQDFKNDNINHNVFGLILGLDMNFNHLILGARIAWDLQDNNGNGTSTMPRYRNVWGQLTLGFIL